MCLLSPSGFLFLIRGIPRESDAVGGKQSGDMYVYMYFNDEYGWHQGTCSGQTNNVQIKTSHSSLKGNHKFLPGSKDANFGTNDGAGKYKLADVIDLATVRCATTNFAKMKCARAFNLSLSVCVHRCPSLSISLSLGFITH